MSLEGCKRAKGKTEGKKSAMPFFSSSQHQIGNYNVGIFHMPVENPAQLRHKDHTVYFSGNAQSSLGRKVTMKR
jgi:hypothetical protein